MQFLKKHALLITLLVILTTLPLWSAYCNFVFCYKEANIPTPTGVRHLTNVRVWHDYHGNLHARGDQGRVFVSKADYRGFCFSR